MIYDDKFAAEQIEILKEKIQDFSWFEKVTINATDWHNERVVIHIKNPKDFFCSDFDYFQTLKDSKIPIGVKCDGIEIYMKEQKC